MASKESPQIVVFIANLVILVILVIPLLHTIYGQSQAAFSINVCTLPLSAKYFPGAVENAAMHKHRHLYSEHTNTKQDTQQADIVRILGTKGGKDTKGGAKTDGQLARTKPQKG